MKYNWIIGYPPLEEITDKENENTGLCLERDRLRERLAEIESTLRRNLFDMCGHNMAMSLYREKYRSCGIVFDERFPLSSVDIPKQGRISVGDIVEVSFRSGMRYAEGRILGLSEDEVILDVDADLFPSESAFGFIRTPFDDVILRLKDWSFRLIKEA